MSEFFLIYLYTLGLKMFWPAVIFFCVGGAVAFVSSMVVAEAQAEQRTKDTLTLEKYVKVWLCISATMGLIAFMTPSKPDLAWIIGGGVVWKVSQNEEVRELPENLAIMANNFIETANQGGNNED